MKNHLFQQVLVLFMISVSAISMAQYTPEYGDTIWGHLPTKYYAPWWIYDDWTLTSTEDSVHAISYSDTNNIWYSIGYWRSIEAQEFTTNRPLQILGLAGVATTISTSAHPMQPIENVGLSAPDYFVLCDAPRRDSLRVLDSLQWSPLDPFRILAIPVKLHTPTSICGDVMDTVLYFKIREYYFNQPITISDTFYVGGTGLNYRCKTYNEITGQWQWKVHDTVGAYQVIAVGSDSIHEQGSSFRFLAGCPTKSFCHYFSDDMIRPGRNYTHRSCGGGYRLIFPIIEPLSVEQPDTFACPRPAGLEMMDRDAGSVWLCWQAHPDQSAWTVGCCEAGQDFDSQATTMDCTDHELVRIAGLRPATEYEIRVQAHCDHNDSLYLSDWSASLLVTTDTLWLNDSTYVLGGDTIVIHHEGIWDVSDSRGQISVFPNPTTGDVTIDCGGLRVERIELLDLQGRVLLREEYSPFPVPYTLSLKGVPPGAYLIRVHTAECAFSRRVVKE